MDNRSSGDWDRDDVMEVALLDFGMARDALDGEFVPKNGMAEVSVELSRR